MKMTSMAEFEETVLNLKEGHTWKCKAGHKIFVLDRGALRFDVPEDWVMELGEKSVRFYDKQPPDDNCRLEVSLLRHSQIDWTGLPLDQLLRDSVARESAEEATVENLHRETRPGVELAWTEKLFIDPQQGQPARSRIAIVRAANCHALITLDFWEADATRVVPAWDEVMRTVDAGLKVQDPTVGEQPM
jgi:hypothetical protein